MVNGEFQLTPEAPAQARRSFAEWKTPRKIPMRVKLKYIRTKITLSFKSTQL